jgi:hypothetical protein
VPLFTAGTRILAACAIWSDSLKEATASIQKEGIRHPTITVRMGVAIRHPRKTRPSSE